MISPRIGPQSIREASSVRLDRLQSTNLLLRSYSVTNIGNHRSLEVSCASTHRRPHGGARPLDWSTPLHPQPTTSTKIESTAYRSVSTRIQSGTIAGTNLHPTGHGIVKVWDV